MENSCNLLEETCFFHYAQFLQTKEIWRTIYLLSNLGKLLVLKDDVWAARTKNLFQQVDVDIVKPLDINEKLKMHEKRLGIELRVDIREAVKRSPQNCSIQNWQDASKLIDYYQHQSKEFLPLNDQLKYVLVGEIARSTFGADSMTDAIDVLLCTSSWQVLCLRQKSGDIAVGKFGFFEDWLRLLAHPTSCGIASLFKQSKLVSDEISNRIHPTPGASSGNFAYTMFSKTYEAFKIAYEALNALSVEELYFGVDEAT